MPRMTFNTNAISHIQNGIDEVVAKHFLLCQNTSLNITINTKKASKARAVSHITQALMRGHRRTHEHNHITWEGIRQPWTAVSEHDTFKQ